MIAVKKTLECSSAGDTRFSAYYARVTLFGKTKTIEEWYQLSKRFGKIRPMSVREAKGKAPTHLIINGKRYSAHYLTQWYKLLWLKYLDDHPELVQYAAQFDEFTDKFRGKRIVNCQADVIRQYVKQGRQSIIDECEYLIDEMEGWDVFMAKKPESGLPVVMVWTDGACSHNGKSNARGGWAFIARHEDEERVKSGGVKTKGVTNNQMELRAVIEVFKVLKVPCEVRVHTDSEYVALAFSEGRLKRWMQNGWRTSEGKPVANKDMWQELVTLIKKGGHRVKVKHIQGHADDELNNRCDALAVKAARSA